MPAAATISPYQTSRPSSQLISAPVRLTTITVSTQSTLVKPASTLALRPILLPPRKPSSAVITILLLEPFTRPAIASGEKPPKITECTAPIRAQANIATAASGIIGIYKVITSPFFAPCASSALLN